MHGGQGGLNTLVHGGMILFLFVLLVGFVAMSLRRGLMNALVLAALIAYAISAVAHFGAATINGFIVPSLGTSAEPPSHEIFRLCWQANQALAKLGVFATGAAYILWSLDLLRGPGVTNRIIALAGFAAGALPAAAIATEALKMDVHGAFIIYAIHALWAALIAIQLIRRKV
jgi:hypothetical protein